LKKLQVFKSFIAEKPEKENFVHFVRHPLGENVLEDLF